MRDELGDVLLQVLFHARIAEDAPENAFGIDDVADALVRKLGNRVPAVLAGESISLEDQLAQWEARKALEKSARQSIMDDIPTAQPALALAQKVLARAEARRLPGGAGARRAHLDHRDGRLRRRERLALRRCWSSWTICAPPSWSAAAAQRGDDVAEELDDSPHAVISADQWRAHWPHEIVDDEPEPSRGGGRRARGRGGGGGRRGRSARARGLRALTATRSTLCSDLLELSLQNVDSRVPDSQQSQVCTLCTGALALRLHIVQRCDGCDGRAPRTVSRTASNPRTSRCLPRGCRAGRRTPPNWSA